MWKKVLKHFLICLWIIGLFLSIKVCFLDSRYYTKCGVVETNLNAGHVQKYHIIDELYLGIRYDDGTFNAEKVNINTFMTKKIGDRICLDLIDPDKEIYFKFAIIFFAFSLCGVIFFGLNKLFDS